MRILTMLVAAWLLCAMGCGPNLLPPPENVRVVAGDRQNDLTWDPVDGALYYKVYWTRDGKDPTADSEKFTKIQIPFTHGELENGVEYRYAVATKAEEGTGALSGAVSATPQPPPAVGTLLVSFKLCCAPEAIGLALWIEDADGNYVDTLTHYRDYWRYSDGRMPVWQVARESDTDGITEASVWPNQSKSYTWDGRDRLGEPAPQGTYIVKLEINDRVWPNSVTSTSLELGTQGFMESASNSNVTGSITYVYTP
ncbi:MAG: DUF2271 domain-containing protein [Pseudomonadota bacterium]